MLNSEEIKKALECCWHDSKCVGSECPFFKPIGDCAPLMAMETLDLINQYEAEQNKKVKEFAERLKEKLHDYCVEMFDEEIDNLLKEMGVE